MINFRKSENLPNTPEIFEETYMKRSTVSVVVLTLALLCAATAAPAQTAKRPLTVDDLLKVRRVGDPQLSPDGRLVAYQISDPDKIRPGMVLKIPLDK